MALARANIPPTALTVQYILQQVWEPSCKFTQLALDMQLKSSVQREFSLISFCSCTPGDQVMIIHGQLLGYWISYIMITRSCGMVVVVVVMLWCVELWWRSRQPCVSSYLYNYKRQNILTITVHIILVCQTFSDSTLALPTFF